MHIFEKHGGLSFGAGASVAYVFVHVFPEVGIFQQSMTDHGGRHGSVLFINQPLYLVALGGSAFFICSIPWKSSFKMMSMQVSSVTNIICRFLVRVAAYLFCTTS